MHKPTPLTAALLALGLACALVLLFLTRHSRAPRPAAPPLTRSAPAAAPIPHPATAPTATQKTLPSFDVNALVAALERALARSDIRANEAVLTFKDDAALQQFIARAARAGLTVVSRLDALRSVRVRFDSSSALHSELGNNAADYESVTANNLIGIPQPPAKQDRADIDQIPFRNETLAYLGATGDRSTWGRGVTVAVLDTGVASDPTFGSGRLHTLDIGLGTTPGKGRDDGHGTSVAALAAGMSPDAAGVAAGANVLSIRVTDANGLSDLFTVSRAIVAAVDAGAKIVNISLGGYSTGAVLDAAIAYAQDRGAVLVAAAGNDQAAQLAWPAADPRVISVGAVDRAEQQVTFSNSSASLQLTAPGYGVQTAWIDGQRAYVDGTSASAPLVSGAITAVLSKNPQLTPQQAAALVVSTASDGGAPGADEAYGRGILNVGWALNRNNPTYVDTAVAAHHYDAANNQMQFVLQNRSGRALTGLSLNVAIGNVSSTQSVPSLAPGESYVAKVPVSETTLRTSGNITYTTQLTNPLGVTDQVPANNRKTSVLTAPAK